MKKEHPPSEFKRTSLESKAGTFSRFPNGGKINAEQTLGQDDRNNNKRAGM